MNRYVRLNDRKWYLEPLLGKYYTLRVKCKVYDLHKKKMIDLDKGSTIKLLSYSKTKSCCCFHCKPIKDDYLEIIIEYQDIMYPPLKQVVVYDYYQSDILIKDNGSINESLIRQT